MRRVIDLFAGCGGFSLGFEKCGYKITKAVEFDKSIANTYAKNHIGTKVIVDDIGKVDNGDNFSYKEADIIIGGPPCQGFSMAGARIRSNSFIEDERNYLFKHYVNVVKIVRPKVFIMENVKGILTMNEGDIFREIVGTLSNPDNFDGDKYHIYHKVVKAVEYGIPQKRERVIIIGVLNKEADVDMVFARTKETILRTNPTFFDSVTVWDAISNMPKPTLGGEVQAAQPTTGYQQELQGNGNIIQNHISTKHSAQSQRRMGSIKSGENWTALDEQINSVHSGAYGRLSKDDVSATITTRFDTPSGGKFTHPDENRTLTPREAARIQSFPDDFIFYGSKSSICKQIGNAVPPKLSYFFANLITEILK